VATRRRTAGALLVAFYAMLIALGVSAWCMLSGREARKLSSIGLSASAAHNPEDLAGAVCGPAALCVALARLGDFCSADDIAFQVKLTPRGTTFGDLMNVAMEHGFAPELERVQWSDLASLAGTAVLWIDGSHFVACDPRERLAGPDEAVRVYDVDTPSQWWGCRELARRWTGEALILRPKASQPPGRDARLTIPVTLLDQGWISSDQPAVFHFSLANSGSVPLALRVAKVGCSCSSARLTSESIAPGGVGELEVRVDVRDKRGFFSDRVLLETNDPTHSRVAVRVAAGVIHGGPTSVREVFFDDLIQGESQSRTFVVHDRGDRVLEVRKASHDWTSADGPRGVRATVRIGKVDNPRELGKVYATFAPARGDYVVQLTMTADPNAAVGELHGLVVIETNTAQPLKVLCSGKVRTHVEALPRAVVLSEQQPQVLLELRSRTGRAFSLDAAPAVRGDADKWVRVKAVSAGRQLEQRYVVSLNDVRYGGPGAVLGDIVFELDDGVPIKVLVAVLPPARTGRGASESDLARLGAECWPPEVRK
jgi:hypothetical protein